MSDSAISERELSPPDQTFWKRYSPKHECPIAGSASMLVHLLALGGVVLAGLAMSWRWYADKTQPPQMSIVYIEGGDGRPLGGGGPGLPKNGLTENVEVGSQAPQPVPTPNKQAPLILPPQAVPRDIPDIVVPKAEPKSNEKAFAKALDGVKNPTAPRSTDGGAGDGGGTGGGKGVGVGRGTGPGDGRGPGAGTTTKAMQAKILADRWWFDSSGSPRERIAKFAAVGITLGFTDSDNNINFFIIEDMKKPPVRFHREPIDRYEKSVKWYNANPQEIIGLARELRLQSAPAYFTMLLPPEREQQMADEEMRYAKERGYDLSKVDGTLFEFRLSRGVYEPVVKGQSPFDWKMPDRKSGGR